MMTRLIQAMLFALAMPGLLGAGERIVVRRVPAPGVFATFAQTRHVYRVGGELRLAQNPDFQDYLRFRRWVRDNPGLQGDPRQGQRVAKRSFLRQICGKCHDPQQIDGAKGGFELGETLSDAATLNALRKLAAGEMPPNTPLPRAAKNAILDGLLEISKPIPSKELEE